MLDAEGISKIECYGPMQDLHRAPGARDPDVHPLTLCCPTKEVWSPVILQNQRYKKELPNSCLWVTYIDQNNFNIFNLMVTFTYEIILW